MGYTHINLTSQERTNENDDDVVVVLSLFEAKLLNNLENQRKNPSFSDFFSCYRESTAFRRRQSLLQPLWH